MRRCGVSAVARLTSAAVCADHRASTTPRRRRMRMAVSSGLAMSWEEWRKHDAVAAANLVRAKETTPRELVA